MSCSLCSSPATHRCTEDTGRIFCDTHRGRSCCLTFAEFHERGRRCGAPACSAVIPAQLDERGPLGWFDLVISLQPVAAPQLGRVVVSKWKDVRVRLCPACSNDRAVVATIAAIALMP